MPLNEDDIRLAAESLGLDLAESAVPMYREIVAEQLDRLDSFLAADLDESPPTLKYPDGREGQRPTPDEDPYNAWLWKCSIRGAESGCLAGKGVSFKDNVAVAGAPLTFGSRALESLIPEVDATIVTRVLDAGGTVVGKNMLNGLTGVGGPSGAGEYGRPLNPHDETRVTGGSSSGSAAAVAAGQVDVSFGGDQGGSIRIPAAWCGVVGLKPTFGLVSQYGISFGWEPSLDYAGPLTRRVEDAARALEAVAGYDPLDPRQRKSTPDSIEVQATLADGVDGVRVGVLDEGFDDVDPGVRDVVTAAADVLASAGAHVEWISVPQHRTVGVAARALSPEGVLGILRTGIYGAFARTHYPSDVVAAVNRLWRTEPERIVTRTVVACLVGELSRRAHHGRVYAKAHNVREAFIRAYDAALDRVDVLVMPTTRTVAPPFEPAPNDETALRASLKAMSEDSASRNTAPFNYTGHPALAVPCGRDGGLPVSMQIVGRCFEDPLLLRVAFAFEQSVAYDEIIAVGSCTPPKR